MLQLQRTHIPWIVSVTWASAPGAMRMDKPAAKNTCTYSSRLLHITGALHPAQRRSLREAGCGHTQRSGARHLPWLHAKPQTFKTSKTKDTLHMSKLDTVACGLFSLSKEGTSRYGRWYQGRGQFGSCLWRIHGRKAEWDQMGTAQCQKNASLPGGRFWLLYNRYIMLNIDGEF